ncbi:MAG: AAA family ATPase [Proteobacteria bacterium]|nr:AAA family ATPase [Pseudomonadota bacterium]
MAMFGAPRAQEDHALRACHSAMRIHARLLVASHQLRRLKVRIGINSGEVTVCEIPNDFGVVFEPVGAVVGIASRLQNHAAHGTTLVTAATRRLAGDGIETGSVRSLRIKGLDAPLQAFVLSGIAARQDQRRRAMAVVGRERELTVLDVVFQDSLRSRTTLLAISGDAGIGKTTLVGSFVTSKQKSAQCIVVASEKYDLAVPFQPIRELLSKLLKLDQGHARGRRSATVSHRPELASELKAHEVALNELLSHEPSSKTFPDLNPQRRRVLIADAIKAVLAIVSAQKPVIIAIEDLQRADTATISLLDLLTQSAADLRLLLIVTFRPGFAYDWGALHKVRHLRLEPLDGAAALTLVRHLLQGAVGSALEKQVLARTAGNPLFLHEVVRGLIDSGAVGGPPGNRVLLDENWDIRTPPSIVGTIADRLDRLPPQAKSLLAAASVLGDQFDSNILQKVSGLTVADLQKHLSLLEAAGFVIEAAGSLDPPSFRFAHGLFQETSYGSLLKRHRQRLHEVAFQALRDSPPARGDSPVEKLAHHAFNGALWSEAFPYCWEAGRRAASRLAHREAATHLENAAAALARSGLQGSRLEDAIRVRLDLRLAYLPLLRLKKVSALLAEVHVLAKQLGRPDYILRITGLLAGQAYLTRGPAPCRTLCQQALHLQGEASDPQAKVAPSIFLAQAQYGLGHYRETISTLQCIMPLLNESQSGAAFDLPGRPIIITSYWIAISHAELGQFAKALAMANSIITMSDRTQPFDYIYVHTAMGFVLSLQGNYQAALEHSLKALQVADEADISFIIPVLASQAGWLLATQGQVRAGVALARRAVRASEKIGVYAGRSRWCARLSEALLLSGHPREALRKAETAVQIAAQAGEAGYLSSALRLRARARLPSGAFGACLNDVEEAHLIARKFAIGPAIAKSQFDRGTILARMDRLPEAREAYRKAARRFRRYQMTSWLRRCDEAAATCTGEAPASPHPLVPRPLLADPRYGNP